MDGIIEGGWGYVWAAYGITWLTLVGYCLSVHLRDQDDDSPEPQRANSGRDPT